MLEQADIAIFKGLSVALALVSFESNINASVMMCLITIKKMTSG